TYNSCFSRTKIPSSSRPTEQRNIPPMAIRGKVCALIGVFSSVWTCTGIRNHSTALRTTKIAPDIISLLYLIFIIQYLFLKWVPHISAIWGTAECHC
ncbi:DUF4491 domain-containing protein, partial [Dysosmobacter welbionis]